MKTPDKKPPPWHYIVAYTISSVLMAPSLAMVFTIVLTIPGLICMILAGLPAYRVHARALAWEYRDQPLPAEDEEGNEIPKPWE